MPKNTLYIVDLDEKTISEGFNSKNEVYSIRCGFLEKLHYSKSVEVKSLVEAAIQSLIPGNDLNYYNSIRE